MVNKFLISFGVILLALIIIFSIPKPDVQQLKASLPWQINILEDGAPEVFGLHLGHSTLDDAVTRFGRAEDAALYESRDGTLSMEVYFGNVQLGPIKSKIITRHFLNDQMAQRLKQGAIKKEFSTEGDIKYRLSDSDRQLLRPTPVIGLSYIPAYKHYDRKFILRRFGEPETKKSIEDGIEQWHYPQQGLIIILNEDDKEVLDYSIPVSKENF